MKIADADRIRVIADLARVLCDGDSGAAIRMLANVSAYLAGTRGAKESDVDAAESILHASRGLAEKESNAENHTETFPPAIFDGSDA